LYATVFREDDEAHAIWEKEIGVPPARIFRLGEEENFWAMGDTGPCGPCSELQYDFGAAASDLGHTNCAFPCECGRYVELWNLVFMQYNRDASGQQTPLPKPSVDTGAGLERLAAALQGKLSNYDTDLFWPLIEVAADLSQKNYRAIPEIDVSLRVIADHARAATFLVSDGVQASNEGRGYVLRRIIRRALYHGQTLGLNEPFLYKVSSRVIDLMRNAYPEVLESANRIATVLKTEEERYARTTREGLKRLDETTICITDGHEVRKIQFGVWREDYETPSDKTWVRRRLWIHAEETSLPRRELRSGFDGWLEGKELFTLYDTFGLRPDFIEDVLRNYRLTIDREGYEAEMQRQRERAKASWKGVAKEVASPIYQELAQKHPTDFLGYQWTTEQFCSILALVTREGLVKEVAAGTEAQVVLDKTTFYAEAGGQVGDTGKFLSTYGDQEIAEVRTTYWPLPGVIAHKILAKEKLNVGYSVIAVVDTEAREATMRNHTGTHLLHAALRRVLGPHVKQSGSLVAPDRLRFDFTHYAALDPEELEEIERQANEQILRDNAVTEERMDLDAALRSGALAFFGDKYPEKNVRVITVPDPREEGGFFSKELCGGTHVRHTGQIGLLKVVSESSSAAGVRRVEAITGAGALECYQRALDTLRQLAAALRVGEDEVVEAVERLAAHSKQLEKQLQAAKERGARSQVSELVERVRRVKDVGVLAALVQDVDPSTMRALVDSLRQKLGSGVVVLGTTTNGKVALIVGVTKDLTSRLHAGKIVKEVAQRVGGSGGGRPDLAEAGGKDPAQLPKALEDVYGIVEKML
ncbi:MAG: alanine--tRNA ligase, partial [Candidatus Acidiferrales bacterium]